MDIETIVNKRAWYERYRPKTLDSLKLPDRMYKKYSHYLNHPEDVPNLLFVGLPGSGKTTLAYILINSWVKHKDDIMVINGAGVGINDIRVTQGDPTSGKIYRFASAPPVKSKYRIVYMEELQKASAQDFYKYFRQVIEQLSDNCIFMVSTNSISELDGPFVQRFNVYTFNVLPKDHINEYLRTVFNKENVTFTEEQLEQLIDYYYPSVREMLQIAQQYTVDGVLNLDSDIITFNSRVSYLMLNVITTNNIESAEFDELVSLIKNNSHLIDMRSIIGKIIYNVDSESKLKLARYTNNVLESKVPDVGLLGMLGDILLDKK